MLNIVPMSANINSIRKKIRDKIRLVNAGKKY
jgi:hypothetical protein